MTKEKKSPSLFISLLPIFFIAILLGGGYGYLKLRIEVLLIVAALLSGLLAWRLGFTYKEIEQGIVGSIAKGMPAILIVIAVGILIASWIVSGTLPMLIAFGLKIIAPQYFLLTACLVCAAISLLTGTSWGTAGTIGVVFMGVASGMGIPLGQAAGAVIAGAYFGDKISPISDTTLLAPIAAGSNLFDHVRHMLWTTVPAFTIGLVIYYFLGKGFVSGAEPPQIKAITEAMAAHYKFHLFLLIPPVIILYFVLAKKPTVPGMLLSSIVALLTAIFYQKVPLNVALTSTVMGFQSKTGVATVDSLLSKGGMLPMMDVTLITFCAFGFAGVIRAAGMLDVLLQNLLKIAHTTGRLIMTACLSCACVALVTGSSYLSILIPGELYAPVFKKMGLAAKNLSRSTEDSGTVVVPLIPWSVAGVYMSGILGVSVMDYAPFAFMNYLGIVVAIFYGFTGIAIAPKIREDETVIGS